MMALLVVEGDARGRVQIQRSRLPENSRSISSFASSAVLPRWDDLVHRLEKKVGFVARIPQDCRVPPERSVLFTMLEGGYVQELAQALASRRGDRIDRLLRGGPDT